MGLSLLLQLLFLFAALGTAYWFWVRPVLRSRPSFKTFYDQEDSFFVALRLKFAGIKERLTVGGGMFAALVTAFHDDIIPYITGIDWTPLTSLAPSWTLPLGLFFVFWFIGKCRSWADEHKDRTVAAVEAGASPQSAAAIADITSSPRDAAITATVSGTPMARPMPTETPGQAG